MTFAEPITQIYHSLFVKNPQGIPNYTAYIEPFKSDVWIVIVGLISVVSPILFCVIRNGQFIDEQQNEFTLAKSFVFATSMLTFMRPWSVTPSSFRGKLAYGRWVLVDESWNWKVGYILQHPDWRHLDLFSLGSNAYLLLGHSKDGSPIQISPRYIRINW